ncbi:alpha/beta hydrolase [Nevskia sp.]|uniref:alpha/beta fold hydrolase n=1 Tax=Nevskia sp. TaxID=1929292 RepID=UPI0025F3E2C2|nr:alpha/beta hydrolase [Nevskia sp.]
MNTETDLAPPAGLVPRYIQANGMEFAYLEALPAVGADTAPLVLVLHGFPDTAWSFVDLLERVAAAGYRAIAPSMRGYAPSEVPENGDYSIATLGQDVLALIEHFGVDRAFVVGHDWGAVAAYAAAALRPDRVRAIVTAAVPHLRRFLLRPSRAQIAASHYIFKFQMPIWPERKIREDDFAWLVDLARSWSPGWIPGDDYLLPLKANFAEPERLKAALAYYRAIPGMFFTRVAWQFLLAPIAVPARVIHGANDACILAHTFSDSEHLFSAGYELVQLADVGHFMNIEAPERFADAVLDFLKRH